ncbi:MAG: cell division protein FtsX [Bacteroidia bacterium]|nr:cell division protein FtsX [Bacteroidia bacterium]
MLKKEELLSRRRLRSAYLTTIISLSLVLFILGLVALLILYAKEFSDYVKENIGFSIIVEDNTKEADLIKLRKILDASRFILSTEEISKEKAAEILKEELGEDFISFLGYNPLPVSIDIRLKAAYANPDSIAVIKKELASYPEIKELFYQPSLIDFVNNNIRKISFVLLAFCGLLFVVSIALINNTVRLTIYSKRFIIKTMQLVGATKKFIRRPFIYRTIIHGFIGSIVAIILLSIAIYFIQSQISEIIIFSSMYIISVLFLLVIIFGILITWISSYFVVNRYLNIKSDNLYY